MRQNVTMADCYTLTEQSMYISMLYLFLIHVHVYVLFTTILLLGNSVRYVLVYYLGTCTCIS